MSQPHPAPAAPAPAPPKGSPLKLLLVIGAIFFITCIGVCGGLIAWGVLANPLPSEEELARLPALNHSPEDVTLAIPLLQEGSSASLAVTRRQRFRYGPHAAGQGGFSVITDSLDHTLRQVTVECYLPAAGDKFCRDTAKLAALSVVQMIDPTFVEEKLPAYMQFADQNAGEQDFGQAHLRIETDPPVDGEQIVRFIVTGRTTAAPSAPATPAPE